MCGLLISLSLCAPCPDPGFPFLGPFAVGWPGGAAPCPRGHGGVEAGRPGEGRRSLQERPTQDPDHPDHPGPRPPRPSTGAGTGQTQSRQPPCGPLDPVDTRRASAVAERGGALALRPVQPSAGLLRVSEPALFLGWLCPAQYGHVHLHTTLLLPVSLRKSGTGGSTVCAQSSNLTQMENNFVSHE